MTIANESHFYARSFFPKLGNEWTITSLCQVYRQLNKSLDFFSRLRIFQSEGLSSSDIIVIEAYIGLTLKANIFYRQAVDNSNLFISAVLVLHLCRCETN